jgi:hypothetical protein
MITCNLMGGLGNQIFQIFATISYAIKSRNKFEFLNLTTLGEGSTTIRYTFWESFFNKLKPFLMSKLPEPIHIIRENGFPYNELSVLEMQNTNVMIYGYFQSYKYFQENYYIIYKLLNIDKMKTNLLNQLNLSSDYLENTVSMHFRIGDYKKLQEYHPLATYDFYERSLSYIQKSKSISKFNVIYFCEDCDIDDVIETINKLVIIFPMYTFTRGTNTLEDWQQMLFMSCCHHNIIANSSFSWWSAYLNSNSDKIVCYPSVWFGKLANYDTRDLCPPDWVRVNV